MHHPVGGERLRRHDRLVAKVEARSTLLPALADVRLLRLPRLGGFRLVAGVLPLAVPLERVELLAHFPPLRGIAGLLEILLQVFLPFGLGCGRHEHVGAGVVAERAVSAASELELDEVLFDLHLGHEHLIAPA